MKALRVVINDFMNEKILEIIKSINIQNPLLDYTISDFVRKALQEYVIKQESQLTKEKE